MPSTTLGFEADADISCMRKILHSGQMKMQERKHSPKVQSFNCFYKGINTKHVSGNSHTVTIPSFIPVGCPLDGKASWYTMFSIHPPVGGPNVKLDIMHDKL
jgi:hypothetical protein